ncbi:hypothetical protein KR093_000953, partial [Drosophila rubida]
SFRTHADKQKFILMPIKTTYTIGRLSTDLILAEDLSISRTHVRLCLSSTSTDEPLTLVDLGSKFGTYINNDIALNKKMPANTPTALQLGDKIRLGALKNIWQVSQLELVTTPSSLARSELEELQKILQPLGAALLPTWTKDCSHLTMDNVSVTVKLLHALLDNKPIVTVAFWSALAKFVRRVHVSENWPNPEDFPPSQSEDMPSIKWNPVRTKLFAHKTVVFCNRKHFELYAPVVIKAGGACKDLNSGVRRQFLTKDDVIVIQYVPSTQSQATETIHSVQEILHQAGRRLIPDYEIGLAILHCSTQKFCNPAHVIMENSLATTESMDSSILVLNTVRTETQAHTNKQTDFVVAESEIYAQTDQGGKSDTQPQADKLSQTKSDQKQPDTSKPDKNVQPIRPTKTKRKLANIVDLSDDETQAVSQSRKITKTLPGDKSKQSHNQNSVAARYSTRSNQVQEQEAEEEPTTSRRSTRSNQAQDHEVVEEQPTTSRRSTRAHQVLEQEVVHQKPSSPRRSTRGNQIPPHEVNQQKPTTKRRSLRGKQSPEGKKSTTPLIDEDSEEEETPFQFKTTSQKQPEKMKLTVPQSDEDSDDESNHFQFTEPVKTNIPTTNKSSIKSNSLPKISVRNFLEKSQNHPAVASQSITPDPAATQPRKRLRLEDINESDSDDNDNLFNFASSTKKQKKSFGGSMDSDNRGIFNFKSNTRQEENNNVSENAENDLSTELFSIDNKSKSKYINPKPKELNRKINVSGWLSCSGLHEDIKPKTEEHLIDMTVETSQVKIKEEDCEENDAHLKWIASMKDSIQIRMCNLNITVRSHDETSSLDTTDGKYSSRKNFKKFKKVPRVCGAFNLLKLISYFAIFQTSNPHPQQRVVELRRMQLAEGMVKVL